MNIINKIKNGEFSNMELIKIFEAIRDYLKLQTITSFRKKHGLSYNGVKFKKNLRTKILKTEYIVDNKNRS